MRITLDGKHCVLPYSGAPFVETEGSCLICETTPLQIRGNAREQLVEHDRITAPAHCSFCLGHVGKLVVVFSTIFGLEEDARILNGRARVY